MAGGVAKKRIHFVKMAGCGNDFIVVDNRFKQLASVRLSAWVEKVCQRKINVGADGVLLLEKSRRADFRMRIFNPDGGEAEMCGNGARCIALFARQYGVVRKNEFIIETKAGLLGAKVTGSKVKLKLSDPHSLRLDFDIKLKDGKYRVSYINTGVPHVVCFTNNLNNTAVEELGRLIRYHKKFSPAGTNADFVQYGVGNNIYLRTYERGVEAETLACGTGAVAASLTASILRGLTSPVTVITRSGDKLKVYFAKNADVCRNVYLEGQADIIFEGALTI